IVLNNCHYAPSITRGVISVFRLYEDGFVHLCVDNTIQGSRNNVVYFCAIPRDGIFEIDLSNSLTNESSIYAVSNKRAKIDLDSALLWHCRLVHISKKRIEKLQHDGLLDSSDLMAFEKCVSCMSGKMARKPYTHQVERAKDLLGLIHTDVCGPFKIMSRQGASYFVTFTDDFSRYGYVYLLKHKHEVFKTFKVFQKEVENQLNTSLNHEKDDLEIDKPQSDIIPIRRSTRTRHAPDRMCLYIDAEEHELGDIGEPANYKAALLDSEYKKWLNAMNVEMQSMKDNEVWVLVELPPNGKTVGSEAAYILGIKIYRDRSKRLIGPCQSSYIAKILKRYCMENFKRESIPMQEKLKLSKSQGASTPAEMKRMQNVPYASAVGSIMYDMRCTRPDVAFAQKITSRFQQNPGDIHWTTVKNILKYLRNTKDIFLVCGCDLKRELRLSYYTDAGYLTDADDLKSQTGYVFVLNGGAVDWKSAKQIIFATSSTEAEYIAAFDASKEAV
nr:retrotransposon protein, putative, Ty1-copia subclass [Tanacetum cinerariifolium]